MDKTICRIIDLPKIEDERGNLSVIEQIKQIPFEIKGYIGFMMYLEVWIGRACL